MQEKRAYISPTIEELGSLGEMTLHHKKNTMNMMNMMGGPSS